MSFIPKKEDWLGVKPQKKPVKQDPEQYGISVVPAQCPAKDCHSLEVLCYKTRDNFRYYKCKKCGHKFKAYVHYQFRVIAGNKTVEKK